MVFQIKKKKKIGRKCRYFCENFENNLFNKHYVCCCVCCHNILVTKHKQK